MKERASEPSHLRPPLDSLTFNSNNHSSHAAMQKNQQNEGKVQRFDAPFFQPLFTSYMQIQYFSYDVENLCTLLSCARVIHDIPAISLSTDPYRTVPTSTEPYFTAQQYSTVRNLPMQSSIWSTRTVLSLTVQSSTVQQPSTVQSPTVLLPTMQSPTVQSSTVLPPTMQPPTVQPSTVLPSTVLPPTMQPPTVQSSTVLPPTMQPPTVQSSTVQSLTVQFPMVQSSTMQPPTVRMQFKVQFDPTKIKIFPH
jgi:hypothetical protein